MSDSVLDSIKVDLSGQVAVVTGASQGLGKAMAIALGLNGARVACLARNAEKLAETVQTITDAGGKAEAFSCDVKSREAIDGVIDKIADEWDRLDIMVNNAGITRDTLLPRMTDDEWDDVIQTNLRGTFLFCRAASRYMMRARYGRIINIASVSGLIGNPGQTNYSASKAGMIGLTRSQEADSCETSGTCRRGSSSRCLLGQSSRSLHHRTNSGCRWRHDRLMQRTGE